MPFITDRLAAASEDGRTGTVAAPDAADFRRAARGKLDAGRLAECLRDGIFGQDRAIASVVRTLTVVQAGLSDPTRPLASQLLVGPTGTGKTEIVRQLAAALRTGPDDYCQVDMSAMAQEHYAASFAGAPPGYSGSKEGHSLFDRDRIEGTVMMPGIVLFDEVEKAHPTVLRSLLHVLDRGRLTLANGQQHYDFRNCLVFLTSNLGSRELRAEQRCVSHRVGRMASRVLAGPVAAGLDGLLERRLERISERSITEFFDPELLNRIDEVTVFDELTEDTALAVARRELDLLAGRARKRGVELSISDEVVDLLARTGFDPAYGARSIRREIRHRAWPLVAEAVITHRSARVAGIGAAAAAQHLRAAFTVSGGELRCEIGGE